MNRLRESLSATSVVKPRRARAAPVAIAAFAACATANAATWEFAPRIEGGYRYNDNYRLDLPGNEIEVSGPEADAELTIRTVDPRTTIEITPRVRATYFPDEREQDSTDYYLRGFINDVTPRRRASLRADFAHEDVVRSELPGPDLDGELGEPDTGDSGRVFQRNRRDSIRLSPYFRYDFTERARIELDGRYVQADFDQQFAGQQQDFKDYGVGAGLGYQTSPRSSIVGRAFASQYETTFDTDAYGVEVEWGADLTETSRFYVRLGGQQTEPENGDSETSIIGGVGGRWDSPRNSLLIDLTRSVGPIAAGTVVERHQLRVGIDHDVSPRLALQFGVRASRDEDIEEPGTYSTREYLSAAAGLEWRWQRFLALRASYNYFWQEYEDEPSDATANGFLISLVYEPKRRD